MYTEIYEELCDIAGAGCVFRNEPMSRHTTFRTGGPADILVTPSMETLPAVIAFCKARGIPYMVIGNGSNLLCGDGGVEGVVIEIGRQMAEITIDGTEITAQAGALLSSIAAKAAANSLTGFEFAAGIPGSLGGAVVMNAGAYGGEMKDVLTRVRVLAQDGRVVTIPAEEMGFSYRRSIVPDQGYIVLQADISLKEGEQDAVCAYMEELKTRRVSKQPLEYPSAGSTFKRPEGFFAGKLIEDSGFRGVQVGGAQVSEKHCGFVINKDHATASDVRSLIRQIQRAVLEKFNVALEPEVKFIGKFTDVSEPGSK